MKSTKPTTGALGALALLLLSVAAGNALALSTDKDQPIIIEADSMEVDEGKGITIYQGNVDLEQGSIRMKADKVTIMQSKGKTDRIIADGNPVKFRQRPDGKDEDVVGNALRFEYESTSELIYLIGDAMLTQGGSSVKSDRITYDRTKAIAKAGKKAKGKMRVRTVIEPRKN